MASQPNEVADHAEAGGWAGKSALHRVLLRDASGADHEFLSPAEIPLLQGMIAARLSAIDVGCRGGGCGICRIKVLSGPYRSLPMSRSRISQEDEAQGIVLACRIIPEGEIAIETYPLDRCRAKKQS